MHQDYYLILAAYFVHWLILGFLSFKSDRSQRTLAWNLLIQLIYSVLFLILLQNAADGGSSLVWLLYWSILLVIHILVNAFQLVRIVLSRK